MANLKNTTVDDSGFLRLPVGDTAARPGSPNGRQIRFNTETGKLEQFRPGVGDWIAPNNSGVIATGGDSVYDIDAEGTTYRVHVFTSTGTSTFSVLQGGDVEYLIVAGGGGGGRQRGGGGGSGGLLIGTTSVTPQSYDVNVGPGGAGAISGNPGINGNNSSVFAITAIGGGGGGSTSAGSDGGSGGGGGANSQPPGSGIPGQGNDGGGTTSSLNVAGGGGGGAGADGRPSASLYSGGNGGIGVSTNINGLQVFYGGGGGGGTAGGTAGQGGLGGGGDGSINEAVPNDGVNNTGGGGGGAGRAGGNDPPGADGGIGGSGIVVIRYPLRQENPVTAPGRDVRNGLVLDLDFAKPTVYNGSGTTVNDSRLNGVTGTLVNAPSFINSRTHRAAHQFVGNNQYIRYERLPNIDMYGLEMWAYFDYAVPNDDTKIGGPTTFQTMWASPAGGTTYEVSLGAWTTRATNEAVHIWNGSTMTYNRDRVEIGWHHLFFRWNGSTYDIIIDGIQTTTYPQTNGHCEFITGLTSLDVGGRIADVYMFQGRIPVFKIYGTDISEAEVQSNFEATRWRFGV